MEIRQLHYYISVVRSGSMRAAAEEHFVTQPAVSIQLKKLEDEVGGKLLARKGRRVVPTPEGKAFFLQAEDIVKRVLSLKHTISDFQSSRKGSLKLGTIDAASVYVLPGTFRTFRKKYPGVEISVEVSDSTRLIKDLLAGRIEVAIVTLPLEREDLEVVPIYKDPMVLVAHPNHPLARKGRGALKAVAESGIITYPAGSTTRKLIEKAFAHNGLPFRSAMEVSSPEAIKRLTEAGLGASVLPMPVVSGDIRKGNLKLISTGRVKFQRLLGMVFEGMNMLSPPARVFVHMLKEKFPYVERKESDSRRRHVAG